VADKGPQFALQDSVGVGRGRKDADPVAVLRLGSTKVNHNVLPKGVDLLIGGYRGRRRALHRRQRGPHGRRWTANGRRRRGRDGGRTPAGRLERKGRTLGHARPPLVIVGRHEHGLPIAGPESTGKVHYAVKRELPIATVFRTTRPGPFHESVLGDRIRIGVWSIDAYPVMRRGTVVDKAHTDRFATVGGVAIL
jgi:hypothetical protein